MDVDAIVEKAREMIKNGDYRGAISLYEDSLKEVKDDSGRAEILYHLSRVYLREGEVYRAQKSVLDAIEIANRIGDDDLLTRVYTSAVDIYANMGDVASAERYIKMGLKHAERASDKSRFNFYNLLAIFSFDRGSIGRARKYWETCLEIAKKIDDPNLIAIAYNNLGEVHRVKAEYRKALDYYRKAYEYSKKSDDFRGMAINLLNMGYVERENGNLEMAEKYMRESAELYEKHHDKRIASSSYANLASILADLGKHEEAMDFAKKAVEFSREVESRSEEGEALLNMGYVYEARGDFKNAMRTYNEARKVFVEISNKVLLSECELSIGRVLLKGNMKDAARFHLEEAKRIAEEIGEFKVVQKANSLLAKC